MSQINTALDNIADSAGFRFENQAEMMDFFKKFGSNGRTFQDFTALTPESMEVLYSVAYNYYTAGKFEDAENVFQLLSVLNHFDRKYWKGLAASRENQGKYEDALKAYGYIAVLDIFDPYAPFHAGKCLICLGRPSDAESALSAAIHNAGDNAEHSELKSEAEGLLKVLAKSNGNGNGNRKFQPIHKMSGVTNQPPTHPQVLLDPTALLGNLNQVKQQSSTSINQALQNLGVLIASPNASAPGLSGAQTLQKPSAMNLSNVSDMTLRMGLLQEALNQLQQTVSKDQIQARLTEQHQDNTKQLAQMNEQMTKIHDAYQKSQDAHKKSNIFQAIADFFKAIVDAICMVFTAIAAVGEALVGDEVGAAGLFASSAAMAGAFVVDTVLAVNQAIVAAGGSGIDQKDLSNLEKASQALGIIAGVAGMLGGFGAVVEGLQDVAAIVGEQALKEGVEATAGDVAKAVGTMAKDALQEGFQNLKTAIKEIFSSSFGENLSKMGDAVVDGIKNFNPMRGTTLGDVDDSEATMAYFNNDADKFLEQSNKFSELAKTSADPADQAAYEGLAKDMMKQAISQTMKDAMINVTALTGKIGMVQGVGTGVSEVVQGSGKLAADNLSSQAAELQKQADQDAAKVKAIEAEIAKLQKLIQNLQDDLQKMMQGMMNSVSSILSAASQSSESVGKLIQSTHV